MQAHPHFMGGPPPGFPPGAPHMQAMQLGPPGGGGMMVPPAAHSYGQQRPPQDFGRPPRQSPLEEGKSVRNTASLRRTLVAISVAAEAFLSRVQCHRKMLEVTGGV